MQVSMHACQVDVSVCVSGSTVLSEGQVQHCPHDRQVKQMLLADAARQCSMRALSISFGAG